MATPMVQSVQLRFEQFLAILQDRAVFADAHPAEDSAATLRISVPFCGAFFEAPVLAKFLSRLLDTRKDFSEVHVLGSDVLPGAARVALASVPADERVHFRYEHLDLAASPLPPADLVLGLHPEATRSETAELWKAIVAQCVRAAPMAIFATLHRCEADLVSQHALAAGATSVDVQDGLPAAELPRGDPGVGYDNLRFCHLVFVRR